jgi:lipopolysaccharide transport system ATP-binding protein
MKGSIVVDGLSKKYVLGPNSGLPYETFREAFMTAARMPAAWLQSCLRSRLSPGSDAPPDRNRSREIWALKDVSFQVRPGEVVGIIGRNGAGKSTLLKVLSRITSPTRGCVRLHGRVGSLLEVGTGFHAELTGRENIFLNGAILGMRQREVAKKFDDIVAFAEIEKFLDTPVKRYSSGMYTRLAFAVASHLEPDILIVDEVLAVGDLAFQKKCLGKMDQVRRQGRTVLFVSHNMAPMKSLCTRGILIENGGLALDGDIDEVVDRYLGQDADLRRNGVIPDDAPRQCDASGEARIRSVQLRNLSGAEVSQLYFGQPFQIHLTCDVMKNIPEGVFEVSISTTDGTQVTCATTLDAGRPPLFLTPGRHEISVTFAATLLPRDYTIDLGIYHRKGTAADFVPRTLDFRVLRVAQRGKNHYLWERTRGLLQIAGMWELRQQQGNALAEAPVANGDSPRS